MMRVRERRGCDLHVSGADPPRGDRSDLFMLKIEVRDGKDGRC